jgi:Na+/H+-dicarboxylate symporter
LNFQVHNFTLTLGDIITMNLTASAAAISTAGIPQAGLVTLLMVLQTAGLHPKDVSKRERMRRF